MKERRREEKKRGEEEKRGQEGRGGEGRPFFVHGPGKKIERHRSGKKNTRKCINKKYFVNKSNY